MTVIAGGIVNVLWGHTLFKDDVAFAIGLGFFWSGEHTTDEVTFAFSNEVGFISKDARLRAYCFVVGIDICSATIKR